MPMFYPFTGHPAIVRLRLFAFGLGFVSFVLVMLAVASGRP